MQRTIGAPVWAALGAIALQCPSIGSAQAYPSFRDVDFFYSQQPRVFQGNSGPANWLLAGQCATPGPTATRLDATQILPNAYPMAFSTLNGATNITGATRGQLTMLRHDASGVDPSTDIPTDVSYFNTSGTVKARIYAATHPASGEIAYRARPNASSSVSYAAAVTTTGTLALGLRSSSFAIKSGETSALEFNGTNYMQLEVFGSSDSALTDLIGLRFVNETHPEGVVVDNFSLGGWAMRTFPSSSSRTFTKAP